MSKDKKQILIIDDEVDLCELVRFHLVKNGVDVSIANHTREGFQKTHHEKPDCVLLDIRLPNGQDGLTFLRRIRSFRNEDARLEAAVRETRVIILTGAGEAMRPLFQSEGIQDYIMKPYDPSDLITRIQRVLAG